MRSRALADAADWRALAEEPSEDPRGAPSARRRRPLGGNVRTGPARRPARATRQRSADGGTESFDRKIHQPAHSRLVALCPVRAKISRLTT